MRASARLDSRPAKQVAVSGIKIFASLSMCLVLLMGMSSVGETVSYYQNIERSINNIFIADPLDFTVATSSAQIDMSHGDVQMIQAITLGSDSEPMQYYVSATSTAGDAAFCSSIQLLSTAPFVYDGPLLALKSATSSTSGAWTLDFFLPAFASTTPGVSCDIELRYKGWNADAREGQGYSDLEKVRLSFYIPASSTPSTDTATSTPIVVTPLVLGISTSTVTDDATSTPDASTDSTSSPQATTPPAPPANSGSPSGPSGGGGGSSSASGQAGGGPVNPPADTSSQDSSATTTDPTSTPPAIDTTTSSSTPPTDSLSDSSDSSSTDSTTSTGSGQASSPQAPADGSSSTPTDPTPPPASDTPPADTTSPGTSSPDATPPASPDAGQGGPADTSNTTDTTSNTPAPDPAPAPSDSSSS